MTISDYIVKTLGDGGFKSGFIIGLIIVICLMLILIPVIISLSISKWWPAWLYIITFPIIFGIAKWIDDM